MSKVYHIGDLHLGHRNILKYRSQFKTLEEHDGILFENILTTVNKRDTLWLHGDIFFSIEALQKFIDKVIPYITNIRLILGNHDFERMSAAQRAVAWKILVKHINFIGGIVKDKRAWNTHAPIHECELRGKLNIHGHVHTNTLTDHRYANVSVDNTNMMPIDRKVLDEHYHNNIIFGTYEKKIVTDLDDIVDKEELVRYANRIGLTTGE